jgi:hypothetical protein
MPANTETRTPIKLTLAQVKAAGLKAYEEGRLSAQGPTPQCAYRDVSGLPCVIGAALPDEVADNPSTNGVNVEGLLTRKLITTRALTSLMILQEAHDEWATAKAKGHASEAAGHEARLVKLLRAA